MLSYVDEKALREQLAKEIETLVYTYWTEEDTPEAIVQAVINIVRFRNA